MQPINLQQLADYICSKLGAIACEPLIAHGELRLNVPRNAVLDVLALLKNDEALLFTQLVDVCGVDYPQRAERFEVVYQMLSLRHNMRVRVAVSTDEMNAVPSAMHLFPSAGWFEREVWDMYGVMFAGHDDLRRILTDYGFDGHPQRKDFPLTGFVELRYDDVQKRVVYEPVKLTQAFRSFDYLSPWEGPEKEPTTINNEPERAA